jgi:hypothetical protein
MSTATANEVIHLDYHVAETIRLQIGNRAFCMLGTKMIVRHSDRLVFSIGTGARCNGRKVNRCTVILDASDTYTVEVGNLTGLNYRTLGTMSDVYADSLHRVIESLTGMRTSL